MTDRTLRDLVSRRHALATFAATAAATRAGPGLAAPLLPLAELVLVANRAFPEVTVLRGDGTEAVRIPLPSPAWQLAISQPRNLLIASDLTGKLLTFVDPATGLTKRSLALDHEPEHMQLDPTGEILAVGNFYKDRVGLVRLAEPDAIRVVEGLPQPHNFSFSADSRTLVVATMGRDAIGLVDVETATRKGEIPVATPGLRNELLWRDQGFVGITDLTLSRDRRFAVAVPVQGRELGVVDLHEGRQITSIGVGDTPWRAYGSATGDLFAVPNVGDGTISLIDADGWRETARVPGGGDMTWAQFAWFDSLVIVNDRATRKLLLVDVDKGERAGEIELPGEPEAGVLDPSGTRMMVAMLSAGSIAIVDLRSRKVERIVTIPGKPHAFAAVGSLNYCN